MYEDSNKKGKNTKFKAFHDSSAAEVDGHLKDIIAKYKNIGPKTAVNGNS